MGADCGDPPVIQDDDPVGIPHRADPLRDQEGGGMRQHRMERLPDPAFGGGINRTGAVVEDQDGRFFEHGPRDAEPLFLSARHVDTALLNPGVVPIRKTADEFVCLRRLRRGDHLFLGGIWVAPFQVVADGAREKRVFLEHYADLAAQ